MTDQKQPACAVMSTARAAAIIERVAHEHLDELRDPIIPCMNTVQPDMTWKYQQEVEQLEMALEVAARTEMPRVLINMRGGAVHAIETNQAISVSLFDADVDDVGDVDLWELPDGD